MVGLFYMCVCLFCDFLCGAEGLLRRKRLEVEEKFGDLVKIDHQYFSKTTTVLLEHDLNDLT